MEYTSTSTYEFYKEIKYNLEIMEKTASDPDLAPKLDSWFLDILNDDITRLIRCAGEGTAVGKKQIESVTKTFEKITNRLLDVNPEGVAESFKRREVARARIEKPMSIQTLILTNPEDRLNPQLDVIGKFYKYMQVIGDGHCLFRAFSYILLKTVPEKVLSSLEDGKKPQTVTDEEAINLRTLVEKVISKEIDPLALLNEEKSDSFVLYLRKCVTDWLLKNKIDNETFRQEVATTEKTVEQYLEDMASMEKREYGGQPEIMALKELFEIDPAIFDVNSLSDDCEDTVRQEAENNGFPLALLLKNEHYNILVPKNLPSTENC